MPKTILKLLLGFVLLIAAQACAPGQPAAPDLNAINTAVAQTLSAAATQTSEQGIPATGDGSPTPTVTPVPAEESPIPAATATSTAILLPTPVLTSTATLSPGVPQVSVSVPTNCRVGPGIIYGRVGGLQVGQVAEVVGRHANRDYWVIRNPGRPNETCWLWGNFATVTGDTSALPMITPPPTPTPAPGFDVFYSGLESCTGTGWWVDLDMENLGGLTFRSLTFTVRDLDTDVSVTQYANGFTDNDGCTDSERWETLPPRESRIVSSAPFNYDPTGHRLRATISLCSNPGQSGTCVTQTVNFRP